jgi:hypothetical protein
MTYESATYGDKIPAELDANPDPNSTENLASATCFDLLARYIPSIDDTLKI